MTSVHLYLVIKGLCLENTSQDADFYILNFLLAILKNQLDSWDVSASNHIVTFYYFCCHSSHWRFKPFYHFSLLCHIMEFIL